MSETNVPITAGSGTNIATLTDSANNRQQIVVIGNGLAATAPVDATKGVGVDPSGTGGLSSFHLVSAGSTNANNVKASAGWLYSVDVFNNAAYPVYVKFHNTSGTPTPGSGVVRTFGVQAGVRGHADFQGGVKFSTGIGLSITKAITDADTTAVLASDCVVDVDYV